MRNRLLWCIAALISAPLILGAGPSCGDDRPRETVDPIFKLRMPSSFYETYFAEAPQELLSRCGVRVEGKSADYRYWIFASVKTPAGEFVALGGEVREKSKAGMRAPAWKADRFGSLDLLSGEACKPISWPIDVFCAPEGGNGAGPPVSQATLDALAADAVRRYTAAFGSGHRFVQELRQQHVFLTDPQLGFLAAAVERGIGRPAKTVGPQQ